MKRLARAWITAEQGRFVLFLPVCMGVGVLAYFAQSAEPGWQIPATLLAVSTLAQAAVWRWPIPRALCVGLVFVAAGFASAWQRSSAAPPWDVLPRRAAIVLGKIRLVEALPAGRRVTIETPSLDGDTALRRNVRIRLRDTDATPVEAGDVIKIRALIRPPSPPDYPGGWDTQRDAFFAGLAGYGFALGPAALVQHATRSSWQGFRAAVAMRIMTALPGEQGAVAATLLTGLGQAIAPDDRAAFQDSGLAHLLAVAGLHIGIVMSLVFGATRLGLAACEHTALHWPTRRIAALASLAAGGFYLALTGAHVPIIRSFAMAALVTLGIVTGRRAISLRGLALAACVLMLVAPEQVVGVSFQMSFSAVLVLIAGYEALRPWLRDFFTKTWWHGLARYALGLALTSALAGTASLPFAVYHFGKANFYYVPANMVAVPLTALWVLPCGLAALLLMPFGLEHLALAPMGWGIDGLIAIARHVAAWPNATMPVPQMPPWGLACVAAGLAWLGLWRSFFRGLGVLPLAIGCWSPWLAVAPDIVVGPDAQVIAARLGGQVFVEQGARASVFEQEVPARVWGASVTRPFAAVGAKSACDAHGCRMDFAYATTVLVRDPQYPGCDGATLLISAEPLRNACPSLPRVDRFSVLDDGATSLFLAPTGPVTVTDRHLRGERPWVIVGRPLLPVARSE